MRSSILVCVFVRRLASPRYVAMRHVTSSHANPMHRYVFSHPSFVLVVVVVVARRRVSTLERAHKKKTRAGTRHAPYPVQPTDSSGGFHARPHEDIYLSIAV